MSPELAHEILLGVQDSNKKLYKMAVELMAPHQGLRVVRVLEMPKRERHAFWQHLLAQPAFEQLGFNLISSWLIGTQIPLLSTWLDALGVPHDGKGCTDQFPPCPSEPILKSAVEQLLAKFRPEVVAVYLRVFNLIDDVQWQPLQQLMEADTRLNLPQQGAIKASD
jgi:hypothetical protein